MLEESRSIVWKQGTIQIELINGPCAFLHLERCKILLERVGGLVGNIHLDSVSGLTLLANAQDQRRAIARCIEHACLAPRPMHLDVRPSSEAIDHTLHDYQSRPRSSLGCLLQQLKL